MVERAEPKNAGCWLDNGRGFRLANAIVEEAVAWGYKTSAEYDDVDQDEINIDEWEFIQEEADAAETWMNEHVAPKGYYFGTHPDFGDWGLYGATMGHSLHDIAGCGPFAVDDFLDFAREYPGAQLVFNKTTIPVDEVLQDEERCGLPDFVDVIFVGGDAVIHLKRA